MDDIIHKKVMEDFDAMALCRERIIKQKKINDIAADYAGPVVEKTCTNKKCLKVYPATLEFFHRNAQTADKLHSQCKKCRNDYYKEYQGGRRSK